LLNSVEISIIDQLGLFTLKGDPLKCPNYLSSLITGLLHFQDFDQQVFHYANESILKDVF